MLLKSLLSRLLAFVLAAIIGWSGMTAAANAGLSGNYSKDTLTVIDTLTAVLDTPLDSPELPELQKEARGQINDYISRYRRNSNSGGLKSFTTMQTALNAIAGYYTAYGARPIPEKLKTRVQQEFKQAAIAVKRGI